MIRLAVSRDGKRRWGRLVAEAASGGRGGGWGPGGEQGRRAASLGRLAYNHYECSMTSFVETELARNDSVPAQCSARCVWSTMTTTRIDCHTPVASCNVILRPCSDVTRLTRRMAAMMMALAA